MVSCVDSQLSMRELLLQLAWMAPQCEFEVGGSSPERELYGGAQVVTVGSCGLHIYIYIYVI